MECAKVIRNLSLHSGCLTPAKKWPVYYTLIYKATGMNQILSFQEDGKSWNTNEEKKCSLWLFPTSKETAIDTLYASLTKAHTQLNGISPTPTFH